MYLITQKRDMKCVMCKMKWYSPFYGLLFTSMIPSLDFVGFHVALEVQMYKQKMRDGFLHILRQ